MIQQTKSKLTVTILILVVGGLIISGLLFFKPQAQKRPPQPELPLTVDIIHANPSPYRPQIYTQGTVEPRRQINLMAEVSGRVVEVSDQFESGGFFKAGDTLIKLDDQDYRFALANANSQVAIAERELALEKGQARQAKRVWRDLGSKEANSLSLREPQVKAASAALSAAIAEKKRAQLNITRTAITVPFDGRIKSTSIDLGEVVTAGSVIGEVFDSRVAEVRLPLNANQFALLELASKTNEESLKNISVVLASTMSGKQYEWQAKLNRIEATMDNKTRLFHVVAEVEKPFDTDLHKQALIIGSFVNATLTGEVVENLIEIPSKAIINESIFVVAEDSTLDLVKVEKVDHRDDSVWVRAPINKNQKIVVSDPRILSEGLSVNVSTSSLKPELQTSGAEVMPVNTLN